MGCPSMKERRVRAMEEDTETPQKGFFYAVSPLLPLKELGYIFSFLSLSMKPILRMQKTKKTEGVALRASVVLFTDPFVLEAPLPSS